MLCLGGDSGTVSGILTYGFYYGGWVLVSLLSLAGGGYTCYGGWAAGWGF